MRALPLMLLLACGDKDTADTSTTGQADTGTGTDTDTDAPPTSELDCTDGLDEDQDGAADCADSDCVCLETDCFDGNDDDLDGLLDCEDSDCVEICVEVCDDGADNDSDGAADCADDECYGIAGCGGSYTLALAQGDIELIWAWETPTSGSNYYLYPFAALLQSTISVSGTPEGDWGGEPFRCTGTMGAYIGFPHEQHGGKYIGQAKAPGYLIDFSPMTEDSSLVWDAGESCPISALPTARLGFLIEDSSIYRYPVSGAPYAQYVPAYVEEYEVSNNNGDPFMVRQLYGVQARRTISWTGIYD